MISRVFLMILVTIFLLSTHAFAASMVLVWPYVQNPLRQATSFVMQSCTVVPPATSCANFTDEATISIATLTYTSPLQVNVFRCWQVMAMDGSGRSLPSNTFCGGQAILNAPGTLSGTLQ